MADDSLLDQMLADHAVRETEAPKKNKAIGAMADQLDATRRAMKAEARRAEWTEAERRTRRNTADVAPEIAGFREGDRFEMRGDRPELRGTWVVERVEPGPAGDQGRRLYARRANGGEGYLPLRERQIQDLLHFRVINRLG